jgi:hypothetical protein
MGLFFGAEEELTVVGEDGMIHFHKVSVDGEDVSIYMSIARFEEIVLQEKYLVNEALGIKEE